MLWHVVHAHNPDPEPNRLALLLHVVHAKDDMVHLFEHARHYMPPNKVAGQGANLSCGRVRVSVRIIIIIIIRVRVRVRGGCLIPDILLHFLYH